MKKDKQNLLVTGVVAGLITVFAVGACSSKETSVAEETPATESGTTVAQASPDTSNLGAGSSGRGR